MNRAALARSLLLSMALAFGSVAYAGSLNIESATIADLNAALANGKLTSETAHRGVPRRASPRTTSRARRSTPSSR